MPSALISKCKGIPLKFQRFSESQRADIEIAKQSAKQRRAVMEKAQAKDEDQKTLLPDHASGIYLGYS